MGLRLIEDAEYLLQPVVYLAFQQGNLHDDAVVLETLHEGVGLGERHFIPVVVVYFVPCIHDSFVDVADAVPEEIHGNGRKCVFPVGVLAHVLLVVVLQGEILPEAQCLRLQPCLLQFDKDEVFLAVVFPYGGGKVHAEHGYPLTHNVGIFMAAHLHVHHLFLQEGGNHRPCDAFVFHKILEYSIIKRICYIYHHKSSVFCCLPVQFSNNPSHAERRPTPLSVSPVQSW